jgi:hypothetical protein
LGRRPKSLHPTALLVHQDRRLPADCRSKCCREFRDLRFIPDISLEENQAPRAGFAKKAALIGGKLKTGKAGDESAGHFADYPAVLTGVKRNDLILLNETAAAG